MKKYFILVALAASLMTPAVSAHTDGYEEVISGRYHMAPKAAWLDIKPLKHAQVHWFLEAEKVKLLNGKIKYDDSGINNVLWELTRKEIFDILVEAKLLTPRENSGSHPSELYQTKEWERTVQQALSYRFGSDVTWCKARLVVRTLKLKNAVGGDLKWWDEKVYHLWNRCH